MPTLKHVLTLKLLVLITASAWSQAFPSGISYQAVVRDAGGNELVNSAVTVEFAIRKNTFNGPIVFEESHNLVSTNQFGLFTAIIGGGVNTGEGQYNTLSAINWSGSRYFLEVRAVVPGQGNSQVLGVTELLAVPYAFQAKSAESVLYEADGDPENELIDNFGLEGTLLLLNEAGMEHAVDLAPIAYSTWNKSSGVVYNMESKVGISINSPSSSLTVNGSFAAKVLKTSEPQFSLNASNAHAHIIICDVSSNDVSVTLPIASACPGRIYKFRKFFTGGNTSHHVELVSSAGESIDGANSFTLNHSLVEYATVVSDGIAWYVIDHSKE